MNVPVQVKFTEGSQETVATIDERVDNLETALTLLIQNTNRFQEEMREFKDEMRAFKDEMRGFKDEMHGFKRDMEIFRDESRAERKERNKQWGELARKMGTIVEDLVAPAISAALVSHFGIEPLQIMQRIEKRTGGESFEVDCLAVADKQIIVIETRSTPKPEWIHEFLQKLADFKRYFPEYSDKQIVPIMASISFPENIIKRATGMKLYVMAFREWEYMDILNFEAVQELSGNPNHSKQQ